MTAYKYCYWCYPLYNKQTTRTESYTVSFSCDRTATIRSNNNNKTSVYTTHRFKYFGVFLYISNFASTFFLLFFIFLYFRGLNQHFTCFHSKHMFNCGHKFFSKCYLADKQNPNNISRNYIHNSIWKKKNKNMNENEKQKEKEREWQNFSVIEIWIWCVRERKCVAVASIGILSTFRSWD